MPKIVRKDLIDVFDHGRELFQKGGMTTANTKNEIFFGEFAKAINQYSVHQLTSRYLDKEIHGKFEHQRTDIIKIKHVEPLNALICYAKQRKNIRWSDYYPIGQTDNDLFNQQGSHSLPGGLPPLRTKKRDDLFHAALHKLER